jgi:predicted transposase YbfD/YdcC
VVRSRRTIKKTGQTSFESRYYLSSALPDDYRDDDWLKLIRGHWGGVEVRNHWRRDAIMGEDRSRSRNTNLLGNLALIRSALLALLAESYPETSLPQLREQFHSSPSRCFTVLNGSAHS